jgi:hypothetical protein
MNIPAEQIEKAFNPLQKPATTMERQDILFRLLNEATKKPRCDLLILPELSVPFRWLPFMVDQARRKQIGMIFGLEYFITTNEKHALNLIATVLPYKDKDDYNNCYCNLRLKNWYAPEEEKQLARLNLYIPNWEERYDLFSWKGLNLSVYNCFELTDIKARGKFRAEIDLLITIARNKDTNYYGHIIDSTTRDLHCFTALVNTAEYGDSRLIAPRSTETKTLMQITGGKSEILMKGIININELRDFQQKAYDQNDKRFKPTPAGYEKEKVRKRNNSRK